MLDYLVGMGDRFAESAAAFEREADLAKSADGGHKCYWHSSSG